MPTTSNQLFKFRVAETGEFAGRVYDTFLAIRKRARKQADMRGKPIDVYHCTRMPSGRIESESLIDTVEPT